MNRAILAFIRKELSQSLRDPRMRLVIFVLPMIQMTIFGLAISTEIRGIRLAAVHAPSDAAARRLADRFYASGWFVPVAGGGHDPYRLIAAGLADAVLVAPTGGLTKALGRGPASLQLLVNATNATKARSIESYATAIVAQETAPERRLGAPQPGIELDVRILYNPAMESSLFMVPGVMGMILCLVTIILTSMSLAKEKESGTFETILAAPLETWEILLGKTIPYGLLGLADALLVLAAAVVIFSVPIRGPLWMLALAAVFFVATTVGVGTLVSTISANQQQAMLGSFLFLFPAVLMSGLMFPIENMPPAILWVAQLNPLKYFVTLVRDIMLKGGNGWVFAYNLSVLGVMAAAVGATSYLRFRQRLN
ncbi:MAG TPA: ABC transporter permease [Elusimicrobia bacterium]|nr:ABC transporter permease [Elusimicrobiota bacterium]HBT60558.1 ABC transporter permease [Elusimicrobiota bacterium]